MSDLLNQASLVMVPSGYKEDTVYSVVPSDGSGDLSFTRASNGTRVNSAGLVEVCPWNLLEQSETIGVSPWSNSNLTITANSVIAPNGTTTADVLTETTATTTQFRTQQTTPQSTNIYTLSVYVKNITGTRQAYIDLGPVTGFFNFATETIYSASAIGSFEKLANGWYRIALTTANAITPSTIYMGLGQSNSETYTGNGTSAIAFWGAQLNIGSTAKPYFPTTDRLNVPRLTYQNGGGGCPSLLLEKQSTNVFSYSEDFTNGFWTPLQITITANNTTSPDGTQNADKITEDAVNGVHLFYNTSAVTGSATSTASIFYKKGTRRYFSVKLQIGSNSYTQVFDADGVTTGSNSSNGLTSVSTSIVSMGNGWVRASVTGTDPSASTACYMICSLSNSATPTFDSGNFNPSYSGSTSEYGFFWGAQLEASSYATSYIPTTSSSATRVADFGSSPLQTTNANWTIFVDTYFVQYEEILNLLINTTTSRFVGFYQSFNYFRLVGNAGAGIFAGRVMTDTDGRQKVVLQNDGTDCIVFVNGVKLGGIDTSGASPLTGRASFQFQFYGGGTGVANKGRVNEIVQFDSKLTDAECIALTTL